MTDAAFTALQRERDTLAVAVAMLVCGTPSIVPSEELQGRFRGLEEAVRVELERRVAVLMEAVR